MVRIQIRPEILSSPIWSKLFAKIISRRQNADSSQKVKGIKFHLLFATVEKFDPFSKSGLMFHVNSLPGYKCMDLIHI